MRTYFELYRVAQGLEITSLEEKVFDIVRAHFSNKSSGSSSSASRIMAPALEDLLHIYDSTRPTARCENWSWSVPLRI